MEDTLFALVFIILWAYKQQINELPTQDDLEEYIRNDSIFLPFN